MARCIQSIAVPFDNLIAQSCNHPRIPPALLQFHTRLVVVPDVRMALRLIHQQLHASAVKLGEVAKTRDKHPTLGASTSDRREADPTLPPYPSLHSHDGSSCTSNQIFLYSSCAKATYHPLIACGTPRAARSETPVRRRTGGGACLRNAPAAAKSGEGAGSSGALSLESTTLACAPLIVRALQSPNKRC